MIRGSMPDPAARNRVVREFVESLVGASEPLISVIHPADEMYTYNLAHQRGHEAAAAMLYYLKGWQIFRAIQGIAAWSFGGIRGVPSFLDFASGFGRVTRFLVRDLEPARVCVAEIQAEAVAFQREQFGVDGLVSAPDAARFPERRRFGFVMATSFFSHVPDPSFRSWIKRLLDCLEPGGVLAFSTNDGEGLARAGEGIVFVADSETDRLDKNVYGTTHVTEAYVRAVIDEAGAGWKVSRWPRGLGGLQDLYAVGRAEGPGPRSANATYYPWGDTDVYEIRGGRLAAAGWVRTVHVGPPVERVDFFANNALVERCRLEPSGPAAARWSFETDLGRLAPDDVLSVRATAGPWENFVALASLRTHPPSVGSDLQS